MKTIIKLSQVRKRTNSSFIAILVLISLGFSGITFAEETIIIICDGYVDDPNSVSTIESTSDGDASVECAGYGSGPGLGGSIGPGPSEGGGGGDSGGYGGGTGNSAPPGEETKEDCEANIDDLTTKCVLAYRQLTIGGAVVTCGALARFSPPLGAFCGFEFNELLTISTTWCKQQGTEKKAKECT